MCEVSAEVGEQWSHVVRELGVELCWWRRGEQETQRGVDGVIHHQVTSGAGVEVDLGKNISINSTNQEPSLVRSRG